MAVSVLLFEMNKIKKALLLVLLSTLCSCGSNERLSGAKTDKAELKEDPLKGCYIGVIKRDTFQLAITSVKGENVEGNLLFDFYEKDRSIGTIKGKFVNGVLLADYRFQSEGVTAERQVIFKKTSRGFVEGYGNSKTKGVKELFVDTSAVDYSKSAELVRSDTCLP